MLSFPLVAHLLKIWFTGDIVIVIIESGKLILRKIRASHKKIEMDVFTRVMAKTNVHSHYYIVPYYNFLLGIGRVKWQKIRRTQKETWSMDGSLRSIMVDLIRLRRPGTMVWKFAWIRISCGKLRFFSCLFLFCSNYLWS